MDEISPRMKISQNGSIGEARTRSFLLNRFWVLERSIDIHGADFLIQPRLTDRTLLEQQRLGIVQAKFVQDGETTIAIPRSYVLTDSGSPRRDFFLIVCTGVEDSERMFLLTAKEVVEDLSDNNEKFHGKAKRILDSENRAVIRQRVALDLMERSLRLTRLVDNHNFLRARGFVSDDSDRIDADLIGPLQNFYGDLQEAFYEVRKNAKKLLLETEDMSDALEKMIATNDPIEFVEVYEQGIYDYVDLQGNICLGETSGIWVEDFFNAADQVRDYRRRLEEKGILGSFLGFLDRVHEDVARWISEQPDESSVAALHVRLDFQYSPLRLHRLDISGEPVQCRGSALKRDIHFDDDTVTVFCETTSVIELCQRRPATEVAHLPHNAPHKYFPRAVTRAVQILLHRTIFDDDEGIV